MQHKSRRWLVFWAVLQVALVSGLGGLGVLSAFFGIALLDSAFTGRGGGSLGLGILGGLMLLAGLGALTGIALEWPAFANPPTSASPSGDESEQRTVDESTAGMIQGLSDQQERSLEAIQRAGALILAADSLAISLVISNVPVRSAVHDATAWVGTLGVISVLVSALLSAWCAIPPRAPGGALYNALVAGKGQPELMRASLGDLSERRSLLAQRSRVLFAAAAYAFIAVLAAATLVVTA
jgi:hypothetical protein